MAKSVKTILVELVLFVTLITMSSHVISNFWDHYVTQNELNNMKQNLQSIKITLNAIGKAYDNLYGELKTLTKNDNKDVEGHDALEDDNDDRHLNKSPHQAQTIINKTVDKKNKGIDKVMSKRTSFTTPRRRSSSINSLKNEKRLSGIDLIADVKKEGICECDCSQDKGYDCKHLSMQMNKCVKDEMNCNCKNSYLKLLEYAKI